MGGSHTTLINNNKVRQYNDRGIVTEAGEGGPAFNATITNNTVSNFSSVINSLYGIHCDNGINATDTSSSCLSISGNLVATAGNEPAGGADIRVRKGPQVGISVRIPGLVGTTSTDVDNKITADNPNATTVTVTGSGFTGGAACPAPAAPVEEDAGKEVSTASQNIESSSDESTTPAVAIDANSLRNGLNRGLAAIDAFENSGFYRRSEWLARNVELQTSHLGKPQPSKPPAINGDVKFAVYNSDDGGRSSLPPVNYPVRAAVQKKSSSTPESGETVTVPVGTLPQNKSVTIKFAGTVNNPPAAAHRSALKAPSQQRAYRTVLTDDPDTATASDPTVTLVDLTITWTGATDTNWNTGSNWNTTLAPVAINDVLIPTAGVTNNPTISASDVTVNSLTQQAGRTLTMSSGRTLNVAGNWTNNGTLTAGDGTVVFNGANNTQTLAGSTTFNNLTINHTGTGNVTATGSTLAVSNLLRIQAGTFISSSTFKDVQIDSGATLQSDGSTMNVSGNWTNNGGTFTPAAGTVIFNSTTAGQTIGGTAATQTFNNLQVNKTGQTLTVGGSTTGLNLNGALTLTAGTFDKGTAATINIGRQLDQQRRDLYAWHRHRRLQQHHRRASHQRHGSNSNL